MCGESPCYFISTHNDLAQYGIERGWLPLDFDVKEEDTVERQEARRQELLQEPDYDLEAVKELQRSRRYHTYRHFTFIVFGNTPRMVHPPCVNQGIRRLHPSPDGLYRGPLPERPAILPAERTEAEIDNENGDTDSDTNN